MIKCYLGVGNIIADIMADAAQNGFYVAPRVSNPKNGDWKDTLCEACVTQLSLINDPNVIYTWNFGNGTTLSGTNNIIRRNNSRNCQIITHVRA